MFKNKSKLFLGLIPLSLIPLSSLLITSCSTSSQTPEEKPEQKPLPETKNSLKAKNSVFASEFGWENKTQIEVLTLIDTQWIFVNKEKLLEGSFDLLTSKDDFENIKTNSSNTTENQNQKHNLTITFDVKPGKSYNDAGQPTTEKDPRTFSITIQNFAAPSLAEQEIEAAIVKSQNLFLKDKHVLPSEITHENFEQNIKGWTNDIDGVLLERIADSYQSNDDEGKLTFKIKFSKETSFKTIEYTITNFKNNLEVISSVETSIAQPQANQQGQGVYPSQVNIENIGNYIDAFKTTTINKVQLILEDLKPNNGAGYLTFNCKFSLGKTTKTKEYQITNFLSNQKWTEDFKNKISQTTFFKPTTPKIEETITIQKNWIENQKVRKVLDTLYKTWFESTDYKTFDVYDRYLKQYYVKLNADSNNIVQKIYNSSWNDIINSLPDQDAKNIQDVKFVIELKIDETSKKATIDIKFLEFFWDNEKCPEALKTESNSFRANFESKTQIEIPLNIV